MSRKKGSLPNGYELIHSMGYGSIRDLMIVDGEPVFNQTTQIVRQVKFHGSEYARPDSLDQAIQHEAYRRLLTYLDQVREVRIVINLEIKFSLPFLGEYQEMTRI